VSAEEKYSAASASTMILGDSGSPLGIGAVEIEKDNE